MENDSENISAFYFIIAFPNTFSSEHFACSTPPHTIDICNIFTHTLAQPAECTQNGIAFGSYDKTL